MTTSSESHFRTARYQPDYPGRFRDLAHARAWCEDFFKWFNEDHHHTGLVLFTPGDVFFNDVDAVAAERESAMRDAYQAHPERFVAGPPRVPRPPARVFINPLDSQPPIADIVLDADQEQLEARWPAQPVTTPVINIPGETSAPAAQCVSTNSLINPDDRCIRRDRSS